MEDARVLLVFPASLFGGRWADGPRVKPELVSLFSELRRAGRTSPCSTSRPSSETPATTRRGPPSSTPPSTCSAISRPISS